MWSLTLGYGMSLLTHKFTIDKALKRIDSLQRIVGTETPASMTWTNGHTYSTIVKHSANCACVKK